MIKKYGDTNLKKIPTVGYLLLDLFLCTVHFSLIGEDGLVFKMIRAGLAMVLHAVGAVSAFVILNRVAETVSYKNSKVFHFLNKYNFTIYLFHQQIIYCVISALNGKVPSWALVLANFVAALIVSSAIAALMGRTKVTKTLVGIR